MFLSSMIERKRRINVLEPLCPEKNLSFGIAADAWQCIHYVSVSFLSVSYYFNV